MVGVFLRLKLRLLSGSFSSPSTGLGLAVAAVAGVGGTVAVSAALLAARGSGHGMEAAVVTAVLLGLGWVIGPVLLAAADDSLDPAKLVLLPLRRRDLATGLLAASVIGVGPLLTAVLCLLIATTGASGPVGAVLALPSAVLLLVLTICVSKAVTALAAGLLRGRRGRDLAVVVAGLAGLLPTVFNFVLVPMLADDDRRRALVVAGRWTPWGAVTWVPSGAPEFPWRALAAVAYAVACSAAALTLWISRLERMQTTADASTGRAGRRRRHHTPSPKARTRRQAICARELRLVRRDPRRMSAYVGGSIASLFIAFPLLRNGDAPAASVLLGCLPLLFVALQGSNAYGFDGSALWLDLVATADTSDTRDDLAGRQWANAIVAIPGSVVVTTVIAAVASAWALLPGVVGVAAALGALVLPGSSLIGMHFPVPLPEKQQNAFAAGDPGRGCLAGLVTIGLAAGAALAVSPLAVAVVLGRHTLWVQFAVLAAGVALGGLANRLLTGFAARRLLARGPELLWVLASAPR